MHCWVLNHIYPGLPLSNIEPMGEVTMATEPLPVGTILYIVAHHPFEKS